MQNKKPFYASASSIKTWSSCSGKYYFDKIAKVPQEYNTGALFGSASHSVLEALLKPRHKTKFDNIKENQKINDCPVVRRYVESYIKKYELKPEAFDKISGFIVTGINYDFFSTGGVIVGAEIAFELEGPNSSYFVRGYIDRLAIYNNEYFSIRDFKTSKAKFSGKDLDENIQALIYALAVKKLYPEMKPKTLVDFLFLAFPDDPKQRFPVNGRPVTDAALLGLEEYLADVYKRMVNFSEKDISSNLAAHQGFPDDGSFSKKLHCGFAKSPKTMKKDGSGYQFHCPYKFKFDYFGLYNNAGELVKTALTEKELSPREGEVIKVLNHAGCPAFKHLNN